MEPFLGIAVFSLVETVTVVAWAAVLGLGANQPASVQATAAVVLFVGYLVEHVVAFNVGKDRPYLSFPRR